MVAGQSLIHWLQYIKWRFTLPSVAFMNEDRLYRIARWVRPSLDTIEMPIRLFAAFDILTMLPQIPLAVIGVIWLVSSTDLGQLGSLWPFLLLFTILITLFSSQSFQFNININRKLSAYTSTSFGTFAIGVALLIYGPIAIWIPVLLSFANLYHSWQSRMDVYHGWNRLRSFIRDISTATLTYLVGLTVYEILGGQYPPEGLDWKPMLIATTALIFAIFVEILIRIPDIYLLSYTMHKLEASDERVPSLLSNLSALGVGIIMGMLSAFGAGLYSELNLVTLLVFLLAAFFAALLSSTLSKSLSETRQRSREMEVLQMLGRDIISSAPDGRDLTTILADHVPAMILNPRVDIWTDRTLYHRDFADHVDAPASRKKLLASGEDYYLSDPLQPEKLSRQYKYRILGVPIRDDTGSVIGGIQFLLNSKEPLDVLPALKALSGQVSAAIRRSTVYEQSIVSEKMAQELMIAGQIQNSFLPRRIPILQGWDLIATIVPARETSGDFYDLIDLGGRLFGILVADVADKGTGAALYMALSRTLIRTYALEHPDDPAEALRLANERILQDTDSEQFVTVFYGVLSLDSGRFLYANAGHNPTLFQADHAATWLGQTGIPLGMFPDMKWQNKEVNLALHNTLVLYSDGITEAQSASQAEFGEERLLEALESIPQGSPNNLRQEAILGAIEQFVGEAEQFDDITLVILRRSELESMQI